MAAQDLIIFEPSIAAKSEALQAFGKALKLKFKIAESANSEENQELIIPEAHIAIVAERLDDYIKNPTNNLNFDEVLNKIREKYSLRMMSSKIDQEFMMILQTH